MKTMLLAAAATLTLLAGTAFARSGAHEASMNSLPAGFNDGNLTYQTRQRLGDYVMDHEKAAIARVSQQPNTISITPRVAAVEANDAVEDD